ncbi:hypothetical protein [Sphingomonas sp. PR090111-T3T-6A]|uniref:hypothetical protein n=1 Tax=Sphingomonas sp. PR090111-T3T-6A TaxID=685778 RepID=UPI00036D6508|nr:hypothetical protein [Sphingomonas sp. PR090111-T3T-6A]
MDEGLQIESLWEGLEYGPPETRATYAALGIRAGDRWVTEIEDRLAGRTRRHAPLPAYHFAEWLTWNWWRLRWEPFRRTSSWELAHKTATIGGGWIWPNITIVTDGEQILFDPVPTEPGPGQPLRYLSSLPLSVSAADFETAIDDFVRRVLERLRVSEVGATNLADLWQALTVERADPRLARFRKLEALLGWDPGEADDALIEQLEAESEELGTEAIEELAADGPGERAPLDRMELVGLVNRNGISARSGDAATLGDGYRESCGETSAWRQGVRAARALRALEKPGDVVTDDLLCGMTGVMKGATAASATGAPLSFELNEPGARSNIVLRSRYRNGRRFDLARIFGDRILEKNGEPLRPVTRSRTHRQKAQIGFAAELLCPIESLVTVLAGDLAEDAYEDAADHFGVTARVVELQLLGNRIIERKDALKSFM